MTNDPTRIGIREARAKLPSLVQQAAAGARFVLTVHDVDRVAVVPVEDLARLIELEAKAKPAKRRTK